MADGTYLTLEKNLHAVVDGISRLQEVHRRPTFQFNGFPAAFVAPSNNENQFLTSNDNQRIYAFVVWIFVEYDQTNPQTAFDEIMECSQEVIDAVDKQENPENASRSMADNLGAGTTLLAVMAAPGQVVPDIEEKMIGAMVTVRCKVTVDLTLL